MLELQERKPPGTRLAYKRQPQQKTANATAVKEGGLLGGAARPDLWRHVRPAAG